MMMHIVRPKIFLLENVTWGDYGISRDNYVMSKQPIFDPPSWISGFYQNFNNSFKFLKNNKMLLKVYKM